MLVMLTDLSVPFLSAPQSAKVSAITSDHHGHETDEEIEAAFQEAENSVSI